jgi:cytoskeleton protein RodZ
MNERGVGFSDGQSTASNSIAQISAGTMLRAARVAQGLHIAALAVALKVPVKKLEALEADRLDLLPDMVFVRALAASVCRTLKIDPDLVLDNLPSNSGPRLRTNESGINVPFRAAGDRKGWSFLDQLSKPFVLVVLMLLVGVVVLLVFPFAPLTEVARLSKSEIVATLEPFSTPSPSTVENPVATELVVPAPAASLAVTGSEVPSATKPMAQISAASLPTQTSASGSNELTDSSATIGLLVFRARGQSWIEVVDANRVVQVRKTMANGEVVGASGVTPLSVVVGRADTTEVVVRGKPFDLASVAKDNVARFEVR